MNKTSFIVHDIVSLVKSGGWDKVYICVGPPNDHEFVCAEDRGWTFSMYVLYYVNSIFQWSFLKFEHLL